MVPVVRKAKSAYDNLCCQAFLKARATVDASASLLLFCVGCVFFSIGTVSLAMAADIPISLDFGGGDGGGANGGFNDAMIRNAVCQLYMLIEGAFGALVMTVAGIAAIVSSAFGAYRAAVGMLVVGLGAFILRALVSLFFGEFSCGGGFGFGLGPIDVNIPGFGIGIDL